MDLNKLTLKSQEAIAEAQSLAVRLGHVEVDGEHLLAALLEQEQGLMPRLLERMNVDVGVFAADLAQELAKRPKVGGPGTEEEKLSRTKALAEKALKRL